jgi:phage recombination protein Bet
MSNANGEVRSSGFLSDEQRNILRGSPVCAALNEEYCLYFFEVCERTCLDPFTAQIKPLIREQTLPDGTKVPSLLIITTLQGLRNIAERSGKHDGESEIEWCDADGVWTKVWLLPDPPLAAKACIYRNDRSRPQYAVVRWDAVVQLEWDKQGNEVPNAFWKRMASHMLGKCTLAACYRGAYSQQCSGLYIPEELAPILDPNSEEGVEAEMIRRASREKKYWEGEREKGNLDIGAAQRAQGVFPRSEQPQQPTLPVAPRIQSPPAPIHAAPVIEEDWHEFQITRIEVFDGRTVGSLTKGEIIGIKPWLEKVAKGWGNVDENLKSHYKAIKARADADYQAELASVADGLEFGPQP